MAVLKSTSKAVGTDVPIWFYIVNGSDWRSASITQSLINNTGNYIAGCEYICKSVKLNFTSLHEDTTGSGDPVVRRRCYRRSGTASISALQHLYADDSAGLDQLFAYAQNGVGVLGVAIVINGNQYNFFGGVEKTSKVHGNPVTTDVEICNIGFALGVYNG